MTVKNRIVRIFTMPEEFPCGPQSSCCGPVGQTEEDIQALRSAIEKEIGCRIEIVDSTNGDLMKKYLQISQLVHTFGPTALPF